MSRFAGLKVATAVVLIIMVGVLGASYYANFFGVRDEVSGAFSKVNNGLKFDAGGGVPQLQIIRVEFMAETFIGGSHPLPPTCGGTPKNTFIAIENAGNANGTAAAVTITYGGANNDFAIAGRCVVGPSGSATATTYILFPGPGMLQPSRLTTVTLAWSRK